MIKPDAVTAGRAELIVGMAEADGFHVVHREYGTLTEAQVCAKKLKLNTCNTISFSWKAEISPTRQI